jgi:hypothetical protein
MQLFKKNPSFLLLTRKKRTCTFPAHSLRQVHHLGHSPRTCGIKRVNPALVLGTTTLAQESKIGGAAEADVLDMEVGCALELTHCVFFGALEEQEGGD